MVNHGVKKYQAEQAYAAVHTAEHEHVARQRARAAPETDRRRALAGEPGQGAVGSAGRSGHDRRGSVGTEAAASRLGGRAGRGEMPRPTRSHSRTLISGYNRKRQTAALREKYKNPPERMVAMRREDGALKVS